MDVKALQWELAAFVAERGLESRHSPKSLAMALVGEGGTLLDLFKWLSDEESRQVGRKERELAAQAIAEIFLHALRLADELGIDVEDAVASKSTKLTGKAPANRAVEAPRAAPPPPPAPAPSPERQARPAASRAVPLAGPPSVRPSSRHSSAVPEFPRVRQAPLAPARPPASPPPRPAAAAPRPAPRPAAPPPPPPPPPEPEVEPYADLDLDAVTEFVKALSKRIDDAQSDDPLARELHDELGTLRRTLYGKTLKRSWIGTALEGVRAKLQEATREAVGEALKAHHYIAEIDRILKA